MTIRFDESLPALKQVIKHELGTPALLLGRALRDTMGRLAFFAGSELDSETIDRISQSLRQALGPYARTDRVLAGKNDFGAESILNDSRSLPVYVDGDAIRLLDRRLVGADWLRLPAKESEPPPRFVFASLKGGVGRSTALSVTAAHLASQGKRILVVDLDMEAPGLGAMLLSEETTPKYGVIDALVENSLSGLDATFLADLVGPSDLAHREGRIDVLPAFGTSSLLHPADILGKIARAYTDVVDENGVNATILDQIRSLIDRVASMNRYDAILVDARAGLHETMPAAIMGLGATEVFLFGLNEPQTFQGYRALFAHLFRLIAGQANSEEFLNRLTLVHAKASVDEAEHREFIERSEALFQDPERSCLVPQVSDPLPPADPFNDVPWDDSHVTDEELDIEPAEAVHVPVAIFHDDKFRHFDPRRRRHLLFADIYDGPYKDFLARVDLAIHAGSGDISDAS